MLQLYSANTPDGVRTGLRAVHVIPAGAWIGPFEGTLVRREEVTVKNNFMWEVGGSEREFPGSNFEERVC